MIIHHLWSRLEEQGFSWFVDTSIKTTIVLLLAMFMASLLHRSSAALRHRIWALGLSGALVIPFLSLFVPQWQLEILPAQASWFYRLPTSLEGNAFSTASESKIAEAPPSNQEPRTIGSESMQPFDGSGMLNSDRSAYDAATMFEPRDIA